MNIVFDLGKVVFKWNPDEIIKKNFKDYKQQKIIKEEVFEHNDWIELDRGTLDYSLAILRATERTKLPQSLLIQLFEEARDSLTPIPKTVELIYKIKQKNYKLFILSNMSEFFMGYLEEEYSFLKLFDGKIISNRVKFVKPEIEIYKLLLTKYKLNPQETIFIDDNIVNVKVAKSIGINALHFTDPFRCEQKLYLLESRLLK